MHPDPPNSLIYSVFLALASAGPLQCERLEPPAHHRNDFKKSHDLIPFCYSNWTSENVVLLKDCIPLLGMK